MGKKGCPCLICPSWDLCLWHEVLSTIVLSRASFALRFLAQTFFLFALLPPSSVVANVGAYLVRSNFFCRTCSSYRRQQLDLCHNNELSPLWRTTCTMPYALHYIQPRYVVQVERARESGRITPYPRVSPNLRNTLVTLGCLVPFEHLCLRFWGYTLTLSEDTFHRKSKSLKWLCSNINCT